MDPMFLPDVERNPQPGTYRTLIDQSRLGGRGIPADLAPVCVPSSAPPRHLARFTQEILRGPAPLSPGMRELIAAYTSKRNQCPF